MADKLMKYEESNALYSKIVSLITSRKAAVSQAFNAAMIFLYSIITRRNAISAT